MKPPIEHVLEKDIIKDIRRYLDAHEVFYWRTPNGGKSYFSVAGVADIIVVWKGKVIGIEVKRPGNHAVSRLSDIQEEWGKKLQDNGGHYFVVKSAQDVVDVFDFAL